jgi:hypothetical protein
MEVAAAAEAITHTVIYIRFRSQTVQKQLHSWRSRVQGLGFPRLRSTYPNASKNHIQRSTSNKSFFCRFSEDFISTPE